MIGTYASKPIGMTICVHLHLYLAHVNFHSRSIFQLLIHTFKMARATKDLTALNDEIVISDIDESNGGVSVYYGTGGLGTLVVEVSAVDAGNEWVQIKLKNPSIAVNAEIDNLAAQGIAWADIVGVRRVRARKSVAGAGPVTTTLTVNNF